MKNTLCIVLIPLLVFNIGRIEFATKKITVIGRALNAKGNAIVKISDTVVYFLDGVESWPSDHYGKQVRVSGKSKIVTVEKKSTETYLVAEWFGTRHYIKNPKWSLME